MMGNDVFANGREVSCKAADGKAIAAFPDVAFTPPQTPATPPGVPIPYPNTALAKDTTDGSKKVKISGKEVMLKNKSYFKTSTGDEAGSAPKKGIITSKIKGKAYFNMWSMDVKFEGMNVVRHLDMTTHNHASQTGQTPPWAYLDSMQIPPMDHPCRDEIIEAQGKCEKSELTTEKTPKGNDKVVRDCSNAPGCKEAMACILVPKNRDNDLCCRPENTGHHLVEVNCFTEPGQRGGISISNAQLDALLANNISIVFDMPKSSPRRLSVDFENYNDEEAPTVCASTSTGDTDHGAMHAVADRKKRVYRNRRRSNPLGSFGEGENEQSYWTLDEATQAGVEAHKKVHPHCKEGCIKDQLDQYHVTEAGIDPNEPVRSDFSQTYSGGEEWLRRNR